MPLIFCSSLLILLLRNHPIIHYMNSNSIPDFIINPWHHPHWLNAAFNPPIMDTQRHPQPPENNHMIFSLLHSLYHSLLHAHLFSSSILLLLILYFIPLAAGASTATAKPPAPLHDIDELINSGNGELCDTMSNCEYLRNRMAHSEGTRRYYVECAPNSVCLLVCDAESPCTFLDVYSGANSALIIDCIDHKSCEQVSVHGEAAYFVYMAGNDPHSIFHSQVQCPIHDHRSNNISSSCIIHGNCIDIDGASHCRQEFTTPIISHLSIYSRAGYTDLQLKCDEDGTASKQGAWCFDENNVILCGGAQPQTCWIDYDLEHERYICDGDDIARDLFKCDDIDRMTSTIVVTPTNETEAMQSWSAWIDHLLSRKQYTVYLVVILCVLLCCCCLFGSLLCRYSAHHQSIQKTNHHKLSFEKENKNCLCCCCYGCYFVWNGLKRRPSSSDHDEDDTGTAVDIEHPPNHTQITVTTDDRVIGIKPLALHSFFMGNAVQTSNTIEAMISPDPSPRDTMVSDMPQTKNDDDDNNDNIAIALDHASLHPIQYITPLQMQIVESQTETRHTNTVATATATTPHPHPPQHKEQPSDSTVTDANTSGTFDTNTQPMHSSSHLDGLEAQATKKLFDAKLGTGNVTAFSNGFDLNHDAFGVAKHVHTSTDDDYKLALQLQQEQLYNAVQGHKTMQSMHNTQSTSHTSHTSAGATATATATATPQLQGTVTADAYDTNHTTNDIDIDVLDFGGGFKIGVANESSSVHETHTSSYSDSSTSTEFDPEYPNGSGRAAAEEQYTD